MPLPQQNTTTGVTQDTIGLPRSINPVRDLEDISYVTSQLLNQGDVAEGSIVPPNQQGQYRVPTPSGFKATAVGTNSNLFTCTWIDIDPSIATVGGYRIYAKLPNYIQPVQIGGSSASPCTISIPSITGPSTVTLSLQPFLSSGLTLPLSACPTTTVMATPNFFLDTGTVNVSISATEPIGSGFTNPGLGVYSDTNPLLGTTITDGFIVGFNASGKQTWSLSQSSNKGVIAAYDGTGTGGIAGQGDTVHMDGGGIAGSPFVEVFDKVANQNVKYQGKTGTPATPIGVATNIVNYLNFQLNGVNIFIPYAV